MKSKRIFNILLVLALLFVVGVQLGQTQSQETPDPTGVVLPYSSTLTDLVGNAVADGSYDFIFRLYASEKDDQPLWTETQTGIEVRAGMLDIGLGQRVPVPQDVAELKELWLEVDVRGPQDSAFTLLNSRHNLNAPDAVNALTCPHSHFTDSWSGADSSLGLLLMNTGTGDGLRAFSNSTLPNFAAVWGANTASTGSGTGVYGSSQMGVGVLALSTNNFGVKATGGGDASYSDGIGDLLMGGNRGEIIVPGTIMELFSNGWVVIDLDDDNNSINQFEIWNGAETLVYKVDESGNTVATGTKSAEVNTNSYGTRLLYAVESSEVWFEEIGTGYLEDGAVTVHFDPIFAETVNLNVDYHVTVTPVCAEAVLLFVSDKTAKGFTVQGVTLDNQPSSCAFDYRVSAKRLGYENTRLSPTDMSSNSKDQR